MRALSFAISLSLSLSRSLALGLSISHSHALSLIHTHPIARYISRARARSLSFAPRDSQHAFQARIEAQGGVLLPKPTAQGVWDPPRRVLAYESMLQEQEKKDKKEQAKKESEKNGDAGGRKAAPQGKALSNNAEATSQKKSSAAGDTTQKGPSVSQTTEKKALIGAAGGVAEQTEEEEAEENEEEEKEEEWKPRLRRRDGRLGLLKEGKGGRRGEDPQEAAYDHLIGLLPDLSQWHYPPGTQRPNPFEVCVCVCVCVWYRDEKERWEEEGWGKGWEERDIYNIYTYVYVRCGQVPHSGSEECRACCQAMTAATTFFCRISP
jgi:hypothetical protein